MRTSYALPLVPLALLAATALPASAAPRADRVPAPLLAGPGQVVPGSYLVELRPGADASAVARARGVQVRRASGAGFAASLDAGQLDAVRRDPAVLSVEQDQVVRAVATQVTTPGLYGLDRTDQRALPLSGGFTARATGAGVRAYVVDSGIASGHPDLGGRAVNVHDVLGGDGQDCHGHGTHVAGTLGGAAHGVAKRVQLRGVRVLGCDGSGTTAGTVAALDWVRTHAVRPAVANLSLSGGYSAAVNRAVAALSASGVFVTVAAGNDAGDSCTASPASAPAALTVAATDSTDTRAPFSNTGACVDTYAPGVGVSSTWLAGGTRTLSGTSMASPHAAGVAALYKSTYGEATSAAVGSWIKSSATRGRVVANPAGTADRLLFSAGL